MKRLCKVFTVARAILYEIKVGLLAENNLSKFEREIAHCETDFQQVSNEYSHIKAEITCLQRSSFSLEQSISHQEDTLASALQLKQNSLAQVIAKSISVKNCALDTLSKKCVALQECQQHLQKVLVVLAKKIQTYRLELRLIRATNSAQQAAFMAIESSENNSNQVGLSLRLQVIRQKQNVLSDQLKAMELLDEELSEHNKLD